MFSEEVILRYTLETTQIGYWDWDIQNCRKYVSSQFQSLFGFNCRELYTEGIWQEALHPDDLPRIVRAYEQHVASRGEYSFQVQARYYHRNGSLLWMQCQGKVIAWDEAGLPLRMVGSHVDVTARKRAEEALEKRNQQLADYAFLNAHKVRGPLARILGLADVLLLADSRTEEEEYLQLMVASARELDTVIRTAAVTLGSLSALSNGIELPQ